MRPVKGAVLLTRDARGLQLQCGAPDSENSLVVSIMVLQPHLVRVIFLRRGRAKASRTWMVTSPGNQDVPWAGRDRLDVSPWPLVPFELQEDVPGQLLLKTAEITLHIRLQPSLAMEWRTADGTVFAQDRRSHPYGVGEDGRAWLHSMQQDSGDQFYGLGDKTGPLDLQGRRLSTTMKDAMGYNPLSGDPLYKHWPFMVVRHGSSGTCYGLLYDTMATTTFDMGCEHSNYYGQYRYCQMEDGDLDYYVMLGPRIRDVLGSFQQLTGPTAFAPRWSLGFHCTAMSLADAPDAQEQVDAFIGNCQAYQTPCSAFHFGSGYSSIGPRRYVFHWNRAKFPDPAALMRRFAEAGIRVVANLKPCLLDDHPHYREVVDGGAVVRDVGGSGPCLSQFWDGEGAHLDFTNPAAVTWWQQHLSSTILKMGISSAWNDNNEYEMWEDGAVCHGFGQPGGQPLGLSRPLEPLLMTRASYEAQVAHRPDERPYTITRAGCPGIQRYGQTWSGDNHTSWAGLRYGLRTGLGMSLSGMFNIGHDVGGFSGPVPGPELLVRWVQAGLLHPRFIMNSWKECGTVTTPWMHMEVLTEVRWALQLRYRLTPYLYSLLWAASARDEPPLRPLFYDFDGDSRCWSEDWDQLMLGPCLMAAPVVQPGITEVQVYLPLGPAGWFDFYTEQYWEAGQTVTVDAPLERLPLFVPAGSVLPLTAEHSDFSKLHDEPSRCLRLFPAPASRDDDPEAFGDTSTFTLYEDNGISQVQVHRASATAGKAAAEKLPISKEAAKMLPGTNNAGAGDDACCYLNLDLASSASEVSLRVRRSGGYSLPYDDIEVSLPVADKRQLRLLHPEPLLAETLAGTRPPAPALVPRAFRMHALECTPRVRPHLPAVSVCRPLPHPMPAGHAL